MNARADWHDYGPGEFSHTRRLVNDLAAVGTNASPIAGYVHRSSVMGDYGVFAKFVDKDGKPHDIYFGVDGDLVKSRDEDGHPAWTFVPTAVRASPSADLLVILSEIADESPKAAQLYDQLMRLAADEARS